MPFLSSAVVESGRSPAPRRRVALSAARAVNVSNRTTAWAVPRLATCSYGVGNVCVCLKLLEDETQHLKFLFAERSTAQCWMRYGRITRLCHGARRCGHPSDSGGGWHDWFTTERLDRLERLERTRRCRPRPSRPQRRMLTLRATQNQTERDGTGQAGRRGPGSTGPSCPVSTCSTSRAFAGR